MCACVLRNEEKICFFAIFRHPDYPRVSSSFLKVCQFFRLHVPTLHMWSCHHGQLLNKEWNIQMGIVTLKRYLLSSFSFFLSFLSLSLSVYMHILSTVVKGNPKAPFSIAEVERSVQLLFLNCSTNLWSIPSNAEC